MSYEDYLKDIHFQKHPEVLDDDLNEHFEAWLSGLDGEEWIEYGQGYGDAMYLAGEVGKEI